MASDSFFLVIEGLDGSGKSEISRRLVQALRQTMGERVKLTFEPHDPSSAGLYIRQVLTKRIAVSPRTLALGFALNRADHNERVITPFLAQDGQRLIICDRYYLSSLVYQSTPDLPMSAVMELNGGARRPDLILFLDASADTCYARMGVRGGDRELFEHGLTETREKYQTAIAFLRERGHHIIEVNADPALLDVLNTIIDVLNTHGPDWLKMQRLLLLEDALAERPDRAELAASSARLKRLILSRLAEIWQPRIHDDHILEILSDLKAAADGEVDSLSPEALGGLFLDHLASLGFEVGAPLTWVDANAHLLEYPLPLGMTQRGAALILDQEGRYDTITRVMLALEQGAGQPAEVARASDFLVVLDPAPLAAEPLKQYEPDLTAGLSASTRVTGRRALADYLYAAAAEQYHAALNKPELAQLFRSRLS